MNSFVEKAKKKHGNKFDYSKTEYVSLLKKVIVICPIHGEFEQVAKAHLGGAGCLKCARDKQKKWIDSRIYGSAK